jgi:alpha-tubulin suppressor-like RCC1 family protein
MSAAVLTAALCAWQMPAPTKASAVTAPTTVAVGWTHTCAIRSGAAYCWGDNTYGELGNNSTVSSSVPVPVYTGGVLAGVTLTWITAGNGFTCALSSGGAAYCWGAGSYGELGVNDSLAASSVPVAVSTVGALSGVTLKGIAAGEYHVCAVSTAGAAYCWGWNAWGQLGNGSTANSAAPVAVRTARTPMAGYAVTAITAGFAQTCALSSTGAAYCWGGGGAGQLGDGSTGGSRVPVAVTASGVLSGVTLSGIAAGWEHTCALSAAGAVYCWGHNASGELGDNSAASSSVPVAVSAGGALSGVTVTRITAGYSTTCALSGTGAAYCWGRGGAGELGDGSSANQTTPRAVSASGALSGTALSQIGAGQYHTCAVAPSGAAYCWGRDTGGQVGDPATEATDYVPVPVAAAQPTTVTAGYSHSCSVNPGGAANCWGDDTYGDLGNNTASATPQETPVAVYTSGVLSGVRLTQVSAGRRFTCALSSAGKAYCWGYNADGQLGDGGTRNSDVPVAVSTSGVLSGVTLIQVTAGDSFACALAATGAAYCWGYDREGNLGDGRTRNSDVPVAVSRAPGVVFSELSAGTDHSCALTPDGSAHCWGYNQYGELGNHSTAQSAVPTAVDTGGVLSGVRLTGIAAGGYFTCALSAAGAGYCWGYDNNGELGNDAASARAQSTAVAIYSSGALSGVRLTQITAGQYTGCALSAAGAGYCWGRNNAGQLGDNSVGNSTVPIPVSTSGALSGRTLTQVSANGQDACGTDDTATDYCWGLNGSGQLGSSSKGLVAAAGGIPLPGIGSGLIADPSLAAFSGVPVTVASLAPGAPAGVTSMPANAGMTVYFTAPSSFGAGRLRGYTATATPGGGQYPSGQAAPSSGSCTTRGTSCSITGLTNGAAYLVTVTASTTAGSSVASAPASQTPWPRTMTIASGYAHACTISRGKAYCWGDDTHGELGNNTASGTPQVTPAAVYTGGVLAGVTLTQVTSGYDFTCALSSAGAVYCWGLGTSGQLGDDTTASSSVPVAVTTSGVLSGVTVRQISAGYAFACATADNGKVYCWGTGANGELGDNTTGSSSAPVAVDTSGVLSGVSLAQVSAGNRHACAVSTAGAAYCWGYNKYGELGDNSTTQAAAPVAVTASETPMAGQALTSVAAGADFTCALSSHGTAYCWGDDGSGQLGNSSFRQSNVPAAVTDSGALYGTGLTSLTAGYDHPCAVNAAGSVFCWGGDGRARLGSNPAATGSVPAAAYSTRPLSSVPVIQVSGGQYFTCAQDATPRDYCWGLAFSGQPHSSLATQSPVAKYVAPQAPSGVKATATGTTATVSWIAPAFTNGAIISRYTATASPGGETCTTTSTSCRIGGLTAAKTYTVRVMDTASPTGIAMSPATSLDPPVLELAGTSSGSLTWSLTGTGLDDAVADLSADDQQITVTDTTGAGNGWHVTMSATTFTSGPYTLPDTAAMAFTGSTSSEGSTSAPGTACVGSCTLPSNTTTYPVSITTGASPPTSYTVYDTQAGSGMGQVTIGGSGVANPVGWWVNVPASARSGSYTTTVTLEVVSGP